MQEKTRLSGAKFVLMDCRHEQIMCIKTDANGEAIIDCLPFGKYYLREVEPPQGYHRCCEEVEIVIDEDNDHRCVEFVNKRKMGSIKIIKYGIDCR